MDNIIMYNIVFHHFQFHFGFQDISHVFLNLWINIIIRTCRHKFQHTSVISWKPKGNLKLWKTIWNTMKHGFSVIVINIIFFHIINFPYWFDMLFSQDSILRIIRSIHTFRYLNLFFFCRKAHEHTIKQAINEPITYNCWIWYI